VRLPNVRAAVGGRLTVAIIVACRVGQDRRQSVTEPRQEPTMDMTAIDDVGGGVRFARFADPDGNSLLLQQMDWRTGENF
jgi:catechol 2,3-dioxygenase-like lactoylglutathione lyase family enzyme